MENQSRDVLTRLLDRAAKWEALAVEARTRAQQARPGDLLPAHLDGCAERLEHNARALRAVINEVQCAKRE